MLVPWYLMASYAYYKLDYSLLEDAEYDELCHSLARNSAFIGHYHGRFVPWASLGAGTGYSIRQYPQRVIGATQQLIREDSLI